QPSEGLFDNFEDYQADFLKTAHEVDALRELADDQLSTEKRALKNLQEQLSLAESWYADEMARLDESHEYWREQIDIATGTYPVVQSIPAAIAAIGAAIANIQTYAPGPSTSDGSYTAEDYYADKLANLQSSG